jgi:predicted benzoate:H+ symporter BenE
MARYTEDFLAAARQGYENTDQPMRELARELGIGITTRQARWRTVIPVLLAWVITLPSAALLAAITFSVTRLFAAPN